MKDEIPFRLVKDFNHVRKFSPEELVKELPLQNPTPDILSLSAFEVMKLCWNLDANARPKMVDAQDSYSFSGQ